MGWIDRNDQENLLSDVERRIKLYNTPNARDALVSQRLGEIYRRHPYMQTGTALSLAEALADDETVDSVAGSSAVAAYSKGVDLASEPGKSLGTESSDAPKKKSPSILERISSPLKAASKIAQGVGQFPWEYLNNYFSRLTDPKRGTNDTEGIIASTTLGALLQNWDESGSGYFLGGEAERKRVEKVRKYRWQLDNNDSYTIGRGTAQMLFQPGSREYKLLSGVIDAAGVWFTDPTNVVVDELSKVAKLRREIGVLGTTDELLAAESLATGAGLGLAETAAIDQSKFFNWMDNTRRGRRVVDKLAEEKSTLRILEGMDYKISVDDAKRLADTNSRDEVRGILGQASARLWDGTEKGMILLPSNDTMLPYASAWNSLGQKLPGYLPLKESRWFAKMPKNMIMVNGTPEERANGVKNLANWLKTIRVDPYSGAGNDIIEKALSWAADGNRPDIYQAHDLFVGKNGVLQAALRQNGVKEEVIAGVEKEYNTLLGQLRSYALNENGRSADKGFFNHLTTIADDDDLRDNLRNMFGKKQIPKDMTRDEMDDFIAALDEGLIRNIGPSALSEMLNNSLILPDVRQMRTLTNPLFRGKGLDKSREVAHIVDTVQNEIWRPYALMTFGFMLRNTFDAHARMAMNGIFQPTNPMHWFAMVTNRRGIGTLSGAKWVDAGQDTVEILPETLQEYAQATHFRSTSWVDDPADTMTNLVRDGQVGSAKLGDGTTYTQGVVDEARLMHYTDPIARIAAQFAYAPDDVQVAAIVNFLNSDTATAKKARTTLVQELKNGISFADQSGNRRSVLRIRKADELTTEELVTIWFEKGRQSAVDTFIMREGPYGIVRNPSMQVLVGYNDVAVGAPLLYDADDAKALLVNEELRSGALMVEDLTVDVDNPQFRYHRVVDGNKTVAPNGKEYVTVIEVKNPGSALAGDEGSPELRELIEKMVDQHIEATNAGRSAMMPGQVKYEVRTKSRLRTMSGKEFEVGGRALEAASAPARWFFRGPVSSFSKMAEKSPAFREIFYRHLSENAKYLSKTEAENALTRLENLAREALPDRFAKDQVKAMEDYIGGRKNYKRLRDSLDQAIASDNGVASLNDLENFAATLARMDAEDMFFSNLERSNFTDAMRILAPFGAAWGEVFSKYMGEIYRNPARIRKVQMTYTGLEGEQGSGFFYRDQQSGQLMFTFPMSSQIIKYATKNPMSVVNQISPVDIPSPFPSAGVSAELVAPVKNLSAGLAVIPSFGPVAQIASSKLFDRFEMPYEDSLRGVINPYNSKGLDALVPGVWKKAIDAVVGGNKVTANNTYATSYRDVFAHLASTGEYDLSDPNDVERMHQDAKGGARVMAMLRAVSQFLGPTAGRPAYVYTKKDRENPELDNVFYVGEMVKVFSELQADNFETAVSEFIRIFGDDAYIYMAGTSRVNPSYKGLEVSKEFEEWRVNNRGLVASHKTTASYLAPIGNRALDLTAWDQQKGEGLRYITDGFDRLQLAQYKTGAGMYRAYREQFPAELTDLQERSLAEYRQELHDKLPGFPVKSTFVTNQLPKMIEDFRTLIADERTQGNPVRDALEAYINYRDENIAWVAQSSGRTLYAKKDYYARKARGNLYAYGQQLLQASPDFARVWEEVLLPEVEQGTDE